jgi:hypothetical protein
MADVIENENVNEEDITPVDVRRKSLMPTKEVDIINVCKSVSVKWRESDIELPYTDNDIFDTKIVEYETTVFARNTAGAKRTPASQVMAELDLLMNISLYYIKILLAKKYGKKLAPAYYKEFGIVKQSGSFILPYDRKERVAALFMMLKAIISHGFGTDEYGTGFWQPIYDKYKPLVDEADKTSGTISAFCSKKDVLKADLLETVRSLLNVLKGYYPKTFETVYREWGVLRENN